MTRKQARALAFGRLGSVAADLRRLQRSENLTDPERQSAARAEAHIRDLTESLAAGFRMPCGRLRGMGCKARKCALETT